MKNKGFTLIEVVIYIGLFAIMIGGVLVSIFQIIQSSTKNDTNTLIKEEINFALKKINWFLGDMTSIVSSTQGSSKTLKIKKSGDTGEVGINANKQIQVCINLKCEEISSVDMQIQSINFDFIEPTPNITPGIKTTIVTKDEIMSTTNYTKP